ERGETWQEVGLPVAQVRLRGVYESLPPSELKVAHYLLDNPDEIIHASVTELANSLGVSESTVVRFCQRLGYQGYQEFKILLARDLGRPFQDTYQEIELDDDAATVIHKTLQISQGALVDTEAVLDPERLQDVVGWLTKADQVYLFGCGGSGGIAEIAGQKLLRLGVQSLVSIDPHTQPLVAGLASPHSVAIGISFSGNNHDVIRAVKVAKERGAKTVAVTNYRSSPLAKLAEAVLLSGAKETPLVSEAGPSRVVQLAVVDALCANYLMTLKQEEAG
ncbi:MAG: MurR/RpiR family transcriptional regulator, partial [Anaerolineales bacterium]|nr:MurR/RpiR family transcriptional regulator [Anaerolineales bacterium]